MEGAQTSPLMVERANSGSFPWKLQLEEGLPAFSNSDEEREKEEPVLNLFHFSCERMA